ncbi:MAG: hypothetical protein P8X80_08665 [Desulfobacterales bacterium]
MNDRVDSGNLPSFAALSESSPFSGLPLRFGCDILSGVTAASGRLN